MGNVQDILMERGCMLAIAIGLIYFYYFPGLCVLLHVGVVAHVSDLFRSRIAVVLLYWIW